MHVDFAFMIIDHADKQEQVKIAEVSLFRSAWTFLLDALIVLTYCNTLHVTSTKHL